MQKTDTQEKDVDWLARKCVGFSVNRKGVSRVAVDVPTMDPPAFSLFLAPSVANLVGRTIYIPGHYDAEKGTFAPLADATTDISPYNFASFVPVSPDDIVDEAEARKRIALEREIPPFITYGEVVDIISDELDLHEDEITKEQVEDYVIAMREEIHSNWMRENCMMEVRRIDPHPAG